MWVLDGKIYIREGKCLALPHPICDEEEWDSSPAERRATLTIIALGFNKYNDIKIGKSYTLH